MENLSHSDLLWNAVIQTLCALILGEERRATVDPAGRRSLVFIDNKFAPRYSADFFFLPDVWSTSVSRKNKIKQVFGHLAGGWKWEQSWMAPSCYSVEGNMVSADQGPFPQNDGTLDSSKWMLLLPYDSTADFDYHVKRTKSSFRQGSVFTLVHPWASSRTVVKCRKPASLREAQRAVNIGERLPLTRLPNKRLCNLYYVEL